MTSGGRTRATEPSFGTGSQAEILRYVLGINAFHADSSACLLVDGELVAAAEEERFCRIKHWAGFPGKAIQYCLESQNIGIIDLDAVAINSDPAASRLDKFKYVLSGKSGIGLVLEKLRVRKRRERIGNYFGSVFGVEFPDEKVIQVEHHLAHLASGFLLSPFEDSVILSLDGFGDFCSTAWGMGNGNGLRIDNRILFPHSLGVFYQAMTQYLGFPKYGDEYKVMGLASYGQPIFVSELSKLLCSDKHNAFRLELDYFQHHRHRIGYEWEDGEPGVAELFSPELEIMLGPRRGPDDHTTQRHKDLARSTQEVYESTVFALANHLHAQYRNDNLVFVGGCAMKSVGNGKFYKSTPFRKVHIHPAAGDAGGAVGAALIAYGGSTAHAQTPVTAYAYLGPRYDSDSIRRLLDAENLNLEKSNCYVSYFADENELLSEIASALVQGKVVGWFQGRMEWGPRALGNRSILCDPRREDAKDLLNSKIKRRESFRPFAPSILREAVSEWFVQDDDVPFMEKVFEIRPSRRKLIPAVTHVDGTGRLQTVTREGNPRYYDLIKAFGNITNVPIILNTSFNENEPIVCHPKEALDCFLRTKMDILVLENYVIQRPHTPDN